MSKLSQAMDTKGYREQSTLSEKRKKKTVSHIKVFLILDLIAFYLSTLAGGYAYDNDLNPVLAIGHITEALAISPFYGFPIVAETWTVFFLLTTVIGLCVGWSYIYGINKLHHDVNTLKGSSEWADPKELSEKYAEGEKKAKNTLPLIGKLFGTYKDYLSAYSNSILSAHFQMSLDTRYNKKAVNTLILGTTGSGKSRYYLKPNLLQFNASYVITDPSGGILQQCGEALRRWGYNVRIFDINTMENCSTYNPFKYCYKEADVKKLVNAFIKNTSAPGSENSNKDPFWDDAMNAFLCSCVSLLVNYGDDPEVMGGKTYVPCFSNLTELTRMANRKSANAARGRQDAPTSASSELNEIFENLRRKACPTGKEEKPYALREWENFKIAPEKTSTTILMTTAVRLDPFNIDAVRNLTTSDTIDLDTFGNQKDVLFIIIPTNDRTYNFLAAFLYTQLFDILYRKGESSLGSASVKLRNNELVQWFSKEEVAEGKDKAFLEEIKDTVIEKCEVNGALTGEITVKKGKKEKIKKIHVDDSYYEIKTVGGKVLSRRPTKHLAEKYQKALRSAKIVAGNGQALPNHVRFLLDEFPNIGEIPEFKEKLATIRKYEISVCVICQSITQLKGMYEKDYEVIDANCPETIFLGGDENTNNEYVSKKLGKTTVVGANISTNERSSGSFSYNVEERDLMKPEEIGRIPYEKCLVMVYGEQPIFDNKFDYPKHKHYKFTNDYGEDIGLKDSYMAFDRSPYAKDITYVAPIDNHPKMPAKALKSILPSLHSKKLDASLLQKIFVREDDDFMQRIDNFSNALCSDAIGESFM